ncbi:MAG: hypothetical protein R2939_12315 [Kofleriaceae bacterium]
MHIPIVQGEFAQAHLCRLVGSLTIAGGELTATVATGAAVEVTIELDRGGRLTARALVPSIGQVFERVLHLLVPEATPAALDLALAQMRPQLADLRADAFRHGLAAVLSSASSGSRRAWSRPSATSTPPTAATSMPPEGAAHAARRRRGARRRRPAAQVARGRRGRTPGRDLAASSVGTRQRRRAPPARRGGRRDGARARPARRRRPTPDPPRGAAWRPRRAALAGDLARWYFQDAAAAADGATDLPRAQRLVTAGRAALEARRPRRAPPRGQAAVEACCRPTPRIAGAGSTRGVR